MPYYPTRKLTILALDPSVKYQNKILRYQIEIPNELLDPGPRGYRVHIVDYDSTEDSFHGPVEIPVHLDSSGVPKDPFEGKSDAALLKDAG